ncbi:hypothetical protein ACWECC_19970 [Streptomyces microflavus]
MASNPEMAWMEVVRLLTQDGQATRQGALGTMGRLCEQDPTLVEVTAHVVRSAMSLRQEEGSSWPALEEAAGQLLVRLDVPLVDKPTP